MMMGRGTTEMPAWVALGVWFLFQVIAGTGLLGGDSGGVAYGAHVGGFIAGLALVKLFGVGHASR
jgi:membrane associated rhomboid family serine protease